MKIQSLSVVVPAKKCINNCKFCVSKMHDAGYEDMISTKNLYRDLYKKDYIKRMEFARDNGCNTVMLTGDCEPLQNWNFLEKFGDYNQSLSKPFRIIEIQTVGNLLSRNMLYFLRHHVGVTTISLSVSDIWNDENNCNIIGCKTFSLDPVIEDIKKYGFNLRLSLNMTKHMLPNSENFSELIEFLEDVGADQVTFRRMHAEVKMEYVDKNNIPPEAVWVQENNISEKKWKELNIIIKDVLGRELDKLEYGRTKYQLGNMGIVLDDDCMSQKSTDVAKYLILRPNAKLYSRWETKASLIF